MCFVQMIDKVWADWQSQSATNAAAFGGGSVSVQVDASAGAYPNGGPPFLNVRGNNSIDVDLL